MPNLPDPLDAVICDMDGLLLDTEAAHRETMKETAAALGFDFPDALFLKTVGVHRQENRVLLREALGPDFPLESFYEQSDALFHDVVAAGVPLRPGLHVFLNALESRRLRRAVVTSTGSPWAEERLRSAGIYERFDVVVTLSDVERPKPAPDPYLKALERLGVEAPRALALEDSHNGVRAAAAAGLPTIMIPDLLGPTDETDRLTIATLPSLDAVAALLAAR